ncbi:hypothetical protein [Amycolatopsis sp. cmx-4-54]|uniref:hypothetical protein n=1 Tax=Amycolatopsis sp. cmx-4-54 TaxID=2790936 RepID=UPI00397C21E5
MYRQLKLLACWLPNARISVGDVGTLKARRFERITSLDELEVPYKQGERGAPTDLSYMSAGKVQISSTAAAGALGVGDGKVSITFGGAGATFLQAAQCRWRTLVDLPSLERELQVLRVAKVWRQEWVLVHKVLHTGPVAILVSNAAGTTVDLRLAPDALANTLPVANASSTLEISNETGLAAQLTVRSGATPFFGAAAFRKPLLGPARLRWRSAGASRDDVGGAAPEMVEVSWDDTE